MVKISNWLDDEWRRSSIETATPVCRQSDAEDDAAGWFLCDGKKT